MSELSDQTLDALWNDGGLLDAISAAVGPQLDRLLTEARAEAWDMAVRECHDLGWLHDFARSDALERNPYRGTQGETPRFPAQERA